MPKGFPESKAASAATLALAVPTGARHFPLSEEPIPEGLAIRSQRGIQMSFMWNGERCFEQYPGRPTVKLVREAADRRDAVLLLIALRKFVYADEFPLSPKVAESRRQQALGRVGPIGPSLDSWFNIKRASIGPNTQEDYQRIINFTLKPVPVKVLGIVKPHPCAGLTLELLPLDELTTERAGLLRTHFYEVSGLSSRRTNNIFIPLRGMYRQLVKSKKFAIDPFETLEPLKDTRVQADEAVQRQPGERLMTMAEVAKFKPTKGHADPFIPDEILAILSQARGPTLNLLAFWFALGLRTGEVFGLQWQDFDLDRGAVCIRRAVSRGKVKTLKQSDWRWVELRPHVLAAVKAQFAYSGQQCAWVFPNPATGSRYANESKLTRRWKKLLIAAGVRYRRPYQARHTYGSMELSAGEPVLKVAAALGHKDWTMLQKHYAIWMPKVGALEGAGQGSAVVFRPFWARVTQLIEAGQVDPALEVLQAQSEDAADQDDDEVGGDSDDGETDD